MEVPCEGETSEMRKSFTAGRNLLPVVGFFCKYFASISRLQKDFPVFAAKVRCDR